MKRPRLKKLIRSTKAKIALALVVVLFFSAGAWVLTNSGSQDSSADQSTADNTNESNTTSVTGPDLNPPTEEQKKYTEDFKQSLSQPPPSPPVTQSGKRLVYPVITNASRSEVNAYVSGVVEDGGTCTATATQGSQVKTDSSIGFANVSYTSCPPLNLGLSPGNWVITVSYTSSTSEGKTTQTFEVN